MCSSAPMDEPPLVNSHTKLNHTKQMCTISVRQHTITSSNTLVHKSELRKSEMDLRFQK